jgi:hypothetical protein
MTEECSNVAVNNIRKAWPLVTIPRSGINFLKLLLKFQLKKIIKQIFDDDYIYTRSHEND